MDSCRPIQTQLTPLHLMPDSERILRRHDAWVAEWDASNIQEDEDTLYNTLVKKAFRLYADGLMPIQVKWRLAEECPQVSARLLGRAQRQAERALCAAETAPPELRRAMVAAQRQTAIQGALAAGDWGPALKGLERAGEIAGELRESAGLGEEDLRLVVEIEASPAPLPAGESEPS